MNQNQSHPPFSIRSMTSMDLEQIIQIHQLSFPDSRSTKLGKLFLTRMYSWYLLHQPQLSFVAEHNNVVIGFVAGTLGSGVAEEGLNFQSGTLVGVYWPIRNYGSRWRRLHPGAII
jgi:hypothetical protein